MIESRANAEGKRGGATTQIDAETGISRQERMQKYTLDKLYEVTIC